MIKVFGYLKRKPGLSLQEFADYYEHNHVPLVLSKAFMPVVYKRNYIQRGDAFNIEGTEISFDCMTELVFADRDDLSGWMASLGVDEIARDDDGGGGLGDGQPPGPVVLGVGVDEHRVAGRVAFQAVPLQGAEPGRGAGRCR